MDRKELIQRYLEAETTFAQEQELADSFATAPPVDEDDSGNCAHPDGRSSGGRG